MYRLVIVDDDAFILEQFVSAFDWEQWDFCVAGYFDSSIRCLEYLKTHPVNAMITDIRMPNLSGLELAQICSELFPDMGIIITTAYSNFEYAHQAIKYNVIDYVLKPIDDNDFSDAMHRLKAFLDKSSAPQEAQPEEDTSTIAEIKQYISQHYQNNISIDDVSSHVLLNPNYFSAYFKKHTGESFTQYLRRFRMNKAGELLRDTDWKISAIAEHLGYKITTPFYKHFYEQYHVTPAEYRQNKTQQ